jgi:predicted amidohydrolase
MKELTVSALQMNISSSASENIGKFRSMAEDMDSPIDIFLLPELWTGMCGADESEAALRAVCGVCRDRGAYAVAGTMPWPLGNGLVNRAWAVNDAGTPFAHYDKAHLFSFGGEDKIFTAGDSPLIFSFRGLDCSVLVSYDIMFPEYSRCAGLAGGKVMFVPAGQPAESRGPWEMLVRSSAASSQVYVVACNAAGDGGLTPESGFSAVVTPQGNIMGSLGGGEGILTSRLDIGKIFKCRKSLPLAKDRRPELYGMITC